MLRQGSGFIKAIVAAHQSGKGYDVASKQFGVLLRRAYQKKKLQTLQASVSILNVKVCNSINGKKAEKNMAAQRRLVKFNLSKPQNF